MKRTSNFSMAGALLAPVFLVLALGGCTIDVNVKHAKEACKEEPVGEEGEPGACSSTNLSVNSPVPGGARGINGPTPVAAGTLCQAPAGNTKCNAPGSLVGCTPPLRCRDTYNYTTKLCACLCKP